MNEVRKYISTTLSILIMVAGLVPALHSIAHEHSVEHDHMESVVSVGSIHCELCDFQLPVAEIPVAFSYQVFIPIKETIKAISFAQTENQSPEALFSLRAPPFVIS